MRSWEDEVAGAEVSSKLPYFNAGFDGDVKIIETLQFDSPEKGPLWIVSVQIVTSNHPAHPVGSRFSWTQKLSSRAAPGAILEFMVAALGGDPRDSTQVEAVRPHVATVIRGAKASPKSNQLVGSTLHLVTMQTKKRDGGPFTKHMWGPATGTAGATVEVIPLPQPLAVPSAPTFAATAPATAFVPPWQKTAS